MTCKRDYQALMHRYLDDETTKEEEVQLFNHLKECNECKQHFVEMEKSIAMVQSASHIEAPVGFTEKVMANLPKETKGAKYRRWFHQHPLITAASLFFVLMIGSIMSTWNTEDQLSVSKQPNLVIKEQIVIVPEDQIVKGDVIVKNGDLRIEGEVDGNVVVINGEPFLASAGNVTGDIEEVNEAFEWLWYNIKKIFTSN